MCCDRVSVISSPAVERLLGVSWPCFPHCVAAGIVFNAGVLDAALLAPAPALSKYKML